MTALNKQALREAAQEEITLRYVGDTSDAWQDEASPEAVLALLDELEKDNCSNVHYTDAAEMEIAALRQRIAELEAEKETLRPVGVMSEVAFRRLENSESRFIALWPRPGIYLPRKRPDDGVIVYARTAAGIGVKGE